MRECRGDIKVDCTGLIDKRSNPLSLLYDLGTRAKNNIKSDIDFKRFTYLFKKRSKLISGGPSSININGYSRLYEIKGQQSNLNCRVVKASLSIRICQEDQIHRKVRGAWSAIVQFGWIGQDDVLCRAIGDISCTVTRSRSPLSSKAP